jgi:GNAT superfamily N-acetyltransferase
MTEAIEWVSEERLSDCYPAFKELRPHLDLLGFLEQAQRQFKQGYHIVGLRVGDTYPSVAGFRFAEFLAWGSVLYIDDLVTKTDCRGKGYGSRLLDWLIEEAKARGCDAVHLDSGYARQAAHRLYLSKGFVLSSHHFSFDLKPNSV